MGPAVRTLFPFRGASMPISLRADIFHQGETRVYPAAALDLRFCVGGLASFRIGVAGGATPSQDAEPCFGMLEAGLLLRAGSRWK